MKTHFKVQEDGYDLDPDWPPKAKTERRDVGAQAFHCREGSWSKATDTQDICQLDDRDAPGAGEPTSTAATPRHQGTQSGRPTASSVTQDHRDTAITRLKTTNGPTTPSPPRILNLRSTCGSAAKRNKNKHNLT